MPLSLKHLLLGAYVFSKNLILIHKNHFFANSIRFYCQSEVTVIFQVKTGLVSFFLVFTLFVSSTSSTKMIYSSMMLFYKKIAIVIYKCT